MPSASRTSAEPDLEETERLPALAMRDPSSSQNEANSRRNVKAIGLVTASPTVTHGI